MEAIADYTLSVPASDERFLRSFMKKMGWSFKKQKTEKSTRLDAAIKAAHQEKLFETNDIDVLMKSLQE